MTILTIHHIAQRPDFLGGKPHIAGTRISVHQIAVLYERHNWSLERIADEHDVTPAQIYAALSYYHDHRKQINEEIAAADHLAHEVGTPLSEILTRNKDD